MVNATVKELQRKNDVVWEALGETLEGMEAHLEQADAPGEWTARQVLCHLLFEPGLEAGRPARALRVSRATCPWWRSRRAR